MGKDKSNSKAPKETREKGPKPDYTPKAKYRVRVAKIGHNGLRADQQGYVDTWTAGTRMREGQPGRPASLNLSESGGKLMTRTQARAVATEIYCSKQEYGNYTAHIVGPRRN